MWQALPFKTERHRTCRTGQMALSPPTSPRGRTKGELHQNILLLSICLNCSQQGSNQSAPGVSLDLGLAFATHSTDLSASHWNGKWKSQGWILCLLFFFCRLYFCQSKRSSLDRWNWYNQSLICFHYCFLFPMSWTNEYIGQCELHMKLALICMLEVSFFFTPWPKFSCIESFLITEKNSQ